MVTRPIICFPFIGDSHGGSYISSAILIRQLVDRGYTVKIVLHENGRFSEYLQERSIEHLVLPICHSRHSKGSRLQLIFFFITRNLISLYRFLKKNRITLVHTNDMRTQFLWALPCLLASVRHVWHQRTTFRPSRLAQFFLARASGVICISNFVRDSLPALPSNNVCVIANAIHPTLPTEIAVSACRAELTEDIDISSPFAIIGWFNTLRQLKRPDVFAQAIAELHEQHSGHIVVIVFGEDREFWKTKMLEYLPKNSSRLQMLFKGFSNNVYPWMAACDVIVSTSTEDGFGRTLIEAMQLRIPVVAADAGGHKEIITHRITGLLAPPGDASATADAIKLLLVDSELVSNLTAAAYSKAITQFSPERHCEQVEQFYLDLL
jgi:glycosyltransferase involved in cell wall biosynthesis